MDGKWVTEIMRPASMSLDLGNHYLNKILFFKVDSLGYLYPILEDGLTRTVCVEGREAQ